MLHPEKLVSDAIDCGMEPFLAAKLGEAAMEARKRAEEAEKQLAAWIAENGRTK